MKKSLLISLVTIGIAFQGCEYSDTKTTTTNVSTTDTGTLNVLHTNSNDQAVKIGDQTYKSSSTVGVQSDGTAEGTKAILDFNFDTPTIKETINLAYDNAKDYTVEESKVLFDQAAETSKVIAAAAQEKFNASLDFFKESLDKATTSTTSN